MIVKVTRILLLSLVRIGYAPDFSNSDKLYLVYLRNKSLRKLKN